MELIVVYDGPRHPAFNMALDEAMLDYALSEGAPILRIYEWIPTGVSLGRSQPYNGINARAALDKGYIIVRRPTGGRALLHAQGAEVTYSIALPPGLRASTMSVEESAAAIARGVALGLRSLGINAVIGGFEGIREEENLCLLRPGASDIVVDGVKVSGSAQLRLKGGLLQHGSILIRADYSEWASIIGSKIPGRLFAGLHDLGYKVDRESLYSAISRGIARLLSTLEDIPVKSMQRSLPVEVIERAWGYYRKHVDPGWIQEGVF